MPTSPLRVRGDVVEDRTLTLQGDVPDILHPSEYQPGWGSMRRGFSMGVAQIEAGALFNKAINLEKKGDPEFRKYRDQGLRELAYAQQGAPEVSDLRQIQSLGDGAEFAKGAVGQMGATMLPAVAGSLAGRVTGGLFGGKSGANIGGVVGGFVPSYQMERNQSYSDQYQDPALASTPISDRLDAAQARGAVGGALNTLVPAGLARTVFRGATPGALGRIGRDSIVEGATETLQETAGYAARRYLDPNQQLDPWELANAGVMGMIGGGAIRGGAEALSHGSSQLGTYLDERRDRRLKEAAKPKPDPDKPMPPSRDSDGGIDLQEYAEHVRQQREAQVEAVAQAGERAQSPGEFIDLTFGADRNVQVESVISPELDPIFSKLTDEEAIQALEANDLFSTEVAHRMAQEILTNPNAPEKHKTAVRQLESMIDTTYDARTTVATIYANWKNSDVLLDRIDALRDSAKFSKANLQSIPDADVAALAAQIAPLMSGTPEQAHTVARQLLAVAARTPVQKEGDKPALMEGKLSDLKELGFATKKGEVPVSVLQTLMGLDRALTEFDVDGALAKTLKESSDRFGLHSALAAIQNLNNAYRDVVLNDKNSFLYSMLTDEAKMSVTPAIMKQIATTLDENFDLVRKAQPEKDKLLKPFAKHLFGNEDRAKLVFEHYGALRRAAMNIEAAEDRIPEDRPTHSPYGKSVAGREERDVAGQGDENVDTTEYADGEESATSGSEQRMLLDQNMDVDSSPANDYYFAHTTRSGTGERAHTRIRPFLAADKVALSNGKKVSKARAHADRLKGTAGGPARVNVISYAQYAQDTKKDPLELVEDLIQDINARLRSPPDPALIKQLGKLEAADTLEKATEALKQLSGPARAKLLSLDTYKQEKDPLKLVAAIKQELRAQLEAGPDPVLAGQLVALEGIDTPEKALKALERYEVVEASSRTGNDGLIVTDEMLAEMSEGVDNKAPLVKRILDAGLSPKDGGVTWQRYVKKGRSAIEVSTRGDEFGRQYSAFNAKLKDGRTIEHAYQVGVKGYSSIDEGKGKPPLNKMTHAQTWDAYLGLWRKWAKENPERIEALRIRALTADGILTDRFATTDINQARALAQILSEKAAEQMIKHGKITFARVNKNPISLSARSMWQVMSRSPDRAPLSKKNPSDTEYTRHMFLEALAGVLAREDISGIKTLPAGRIEDVILDFPGGERGKNALKVGQVSWEGKLRAHKEALTKSGDEDALAALEQVLAEETKNLAQFRRKLEKLLNLVELTNPVVDHTPAPITPARRWTKDPVSSAELRDTDAPPDKQREAAHNFFQPLLSALTKRLAELPANATAERTSLERRRNALLRAQNKADEAVGGFKSPKARAEWSAASRLVTPRAPSDLSQRRDAEWGAAMREAVQNIFQQLFSDLAKRQSELPANAIAERASIERHRNALRQAQNKANEMGLEIYLEGQQTPGMPETDGESTKPRIYEEDDGSKIGKKIAGKRRVDDGTGAARRAMDQLVAAGKTIQSQITKLQKTKPGAWEKQVNKLIDDLRKLRENYKTVRTLLAAFSDEETTTPAKRLLLFHMEKFGATTNIEGNTNAAMRQELYDNWFYESTRLRAADAATPFIGPPTKELQKLTEQLERAIVQTQKEITSKTPIERKKATAGITITQDTDAGYGPRTKANADAAQATMALAADFTTAGEKATARYAGTRLVAFEGNLESKADYAAFARAIVAKLQKDPGGGRTLNVAGNGVYTWIKHGWTQDRVNKAVYHVLQQVKEQHPGLERIVSGGQTGTDIAGAIAGAALGLDVHIHMPKDLKYRDKNNRNQNIASTSVMRDLIQQRAEALKNPSSTDKARTPETHTGVMMRYRDGYPHGHVMRAENKGKSTFDLILEGKRTATTRNDRPPYEVGDTVEFVDGQGRKVEVIVTKAPYQASEVTAAEWSRLEGWDPSVHARYANRDAWQFQYKLKTANAVPQTPSVVAAVNAERVVRTANPEKQAELQALGYQETAPNRFAPADETSPRLTNAQLHWLRDTIQGKYASLTTDADWEKYKRMVPLAVKQIQDKPEKDRSENEKTLLRMVGAPVSRASKQSRAVRDELGKSGIAGTHVSKNLFPDFSKWREKLRSGTGGHVQGVGIYIGTGDNTHRNYKEILTNRLRKDLGISGQIEGAPVSKDGVAPTYMVTLKINPEKDLFNWDEAVSNLPPDVQARLSAAMEELGLSPLKDNHPEHTGGQTIYRMMQDTYYKKWQADPKYQGREGEKRWDTDSGLLVTALLQKHGFKGHQYMTSLDDRPDNINYVIYDENVIEQNYVLFNKQRPRKKGRPPTPKRTTEQWRRQWREQKAVHDRIARDLENARREARETSGQQEVLSREAVPTHAVKFEALKNLRISWVEQEGEHVLEIVGPFNMSAISEQDQVLRYVLSVHGFKVDSMKRVGSEPTYVRVNYDAELFKRSEAGRQMGLTHKEMRRWLSSPDGLNVKLEVAAGEPDTYGAYTLNTKLGTDGKLGLQVIHGNAISDTGEGLDPSQYKAAVAKIKTSFAIYMRDHGKNPAGSRYPYKHPDSILTSWWDTLNISDVERTPAPDPIYPQSAEGEAAPSSPEITRLEKELAASQKKLDKIEAKGQESTQTRWVYEDLLEELVTLRGPDIELVIERAFGAMDNQSGSWTRDLLWHKRVIEVAINAGDGAQIRSVAMHEAMHDLFEYLMDHPSEGARKIAAALIKAADAPHIIQQLRIRLDGDPSAIAQLSDRSERIAYVFQFWASDPTFRITPATRNIFQKIAQVIREVLRIVSDYEKAEQLLVHFQAGRLAMPGVVNNRIAERDALHQEQLKDTYALTSETAREKLDRLAPWVVRSYDVVLTDSAQRLRAYNYAPLNNLVDMFYRHIKDGEMGGMGLLQERTHRENQFMNKFYSIIGDMSVADQKKLQRELNTGVFGPQHAKADEIRELLEDVYKYMQKKGVQRSNGLNADGTVKWEDIPHRNNFSHRKWEASAITRNQEMFRRLLMEVGYDRAQAEAITSSLIAGDGRIDIAENEHHLGYVPFAAGIEARRLTKIGVHNAHKFAQFMSDDLVDTMSTYLRQVVHRAEYAERLGNGGEAIQEMFKDAPFTDTEKADILRQIQALEGTLGHDLSHKLKTGFGVAVTVQNVILLSMAAFTMVVDPMGIALRTGKWSDAGKAYVQAMKDLRKFILRDKSRDWGHEMADFIGITSKTSMLEAYGQVQGSMYMGRATRKVNMWFFKWNGMEGLTSSYRVAALEAGNRWIKENLDHEQAMMELDLNPKHVYVKSNGYIAIKPEEIYGEIISKKPGTPIHEAKRMADEAAVEIGKAMFRFVDSAIIRPNAAHRPSWMSDPRFILIAHLKQFATSFQSIILQRVSKETFINGKNMPAAMLMTYMPIMMAADIAKWAMIPTTTTLPQHWEWADYVSHMVKRSGILGKGEFGVDVVGDAARGNIPGASLMGPTAEHAVELSQWLAGDPRTTTDGLIDRTVPLKRYFF